MTSNTGGKIQEVSEIWSITVTYELLNFIPRKLHGFSKRNFITQILGSNIRFKLLWYQYFSYNFYNGPAEHMGVQSVEYKVGLWSLFW
jgi:hypothetical protein